MTEKHKMIYLCLAHMSEEGLEQKYIKEAFDTNWVVPLGPNVNAFESLLASYVNSSCSSEEGREEAKVVALSSGTAAVHLALLACGVGPGDEVCVQTFTFCASSHPVTYLGATPVFIDSEPDTWNMDPDLLEQAILDRKAKTGKYPKAIVPVSLYGMPYDCERIMAIADKYDIPVIEDAAEGLGSRFNGRNLGTFGTYGILSFNGNKMITTSGGGAVICNGKSSQLSLDGMDSSKSILLGNDLGKASGDDLEVAAANAQTIMWYATQARDAYPYYHHTAIGYNYRMSNICAGIGRGQMSVLDDHINHHKHIQALYEQLLADVPGITVHKAPSALAKDGKTPLFDSNFWLSAITLSPDLKIQGQEHAYKKAVKSAIGGAAGVIQMVDSPTTDCQPNDNVEALRIFLHSKNIEARPAWKPMHKQPVYAQAPAYLNGVSESIFKVGLCLPTGPMVTDQDVHYIVTSIIQALSPSS